MLLAIIFCAGIFGSTVHAAKKNAPEVWWDEEDNAQICTRYNMTGTYYEYVVLKCNGVVVYEGWDYWGSAHVIDDARSSFGTNEFEQYITVTGNYSFQKGLSATKSSTDMIWSNVATKYFNLNLPKVTAPVILGWTDDYNVMVVPNKDAKWYAVELYKNGSRTSYFDMGVDVASNYYCQCRKGANGTVLIDFDRDFEQGSTYTVKIKAKPLNSAKYTESDFVSSSKICSNDYIKQYYPVKNLKWNLRKKSISFYPNNNGTEYKIKLVYLENGAEWDIGVWGPDDGSILRTHELKDYIKYTGHYQVLILIGDDVFDAEFTAYTPGVNASDIVAYDAKKKSFAIDNAYASKSNTTTANTTTTVSITGIDLMGYTLAGIYAPFACVDAGNGAYVASPGIIGGVNSNTSIVLVATLNNGTTQTVYGVIDPTNSLTVGAFNGVPVSIAVYIK